MIWRGDASKTIDLKKDPDKNYKNLQKAMAKILKNYPPQARKQEAEDDRSRGTSLRSTEQSGRRDAPR